jgi:hypothetical protein
MEVMTSRTPGPDYDLVIVVGGFAVRQFYTD